MKIKSPYLLFLGDVQDKLAAKTAGGVAYWCPEKCVGQMRLPECKVDLQLPDLSLEEGLSKGAKTLLIGAVNRGGVIAQNWIPYLQKALVLGYDLASGLHQKLSSIEALYTIAQNNGQLLDIRHPTQDYPIANALKRTGKRLLTVGTDCSIGKMFTSLCLTRDLQKRGIDAEFKATGQTGLFIAGSGICVDAIVSDFIAGAVEVLSPNHSETHWDIIEGQGSLFHPSFAGVTLGLIHGSQPDAIVVCHEPNRDHMRGLPHFKLPDLEDCIEANLKAASLVNPNVECAGLSFNTSVLQEDQRLPFLEAMRLKYPFPCIDPSIDTSPILDRLGQRYKMAS